MSCKTKLKCIGVVLLTMLSSVLASIWPVHLGNIYTDISNNEITSVHQCLSTVLMFGLIYLAAERGIADRFHFPGFMRGKQVYECLKDSDVYVMPSVSEPFGISPLEAMQCGTPTIISKQSGCGEILSNCIKVDYWDIHALADAIYSICHNESLFDYLSEEGKKEVDQITWEKVGARIKDLYLKTLGWK